VDTGGRGVCTPWARRCSWSEELAVEILDTAKGESASIKKKLEVQRMAEANKAFAHFAR
jgi:small subunit ribosomal protein S7